MSRLDRDFVVQDSYLSVVQKLSDAIDDDLALGDAFKKAIESVLETNNSATRCIQTVDDYLSYVDQVLRTSPYQDGNSRNMMTTLTNLWLFISQPSLSALQSPLEPGSTKGGTTQQQLTFLSEWFRKYCSELVKLDIMVWTW